MNTQKRLSIWLHSNSKLEPPRTAKYKSPQGSKMEPRFNEPPYNEVFGITNDILQLREFKSR